jgi:nucleotide-binding universal stress UspA family protein
MSSIDRILLCYDGTQSGQASLRCGSALVQQLNAEAHLLAMLDCCCIDGRRDPLPVVEFDLDEQAAMAILHQGVARLRALTSAATGYLLLGNPVDEVSRLANIVKADLIVIGQSPGSAFTRWWVSDNSTSLLRGVTCGVLFESAFASNRLKASRSA